MDNNQTSQPNPESNQQSPQKEVPAEQSQGHQLAEVD
jgi:hypothetical protein